MLITGEVPHDILIPNTKSTLLVLVTKTSYCSAKRRRHSGLVDLNAIFANYLGYRDNIVTYLCMPIKFRIESVLIAVTAGDVINHRNIAELSFEISIGHAVVYGFPLNLSGPNFFRHRNRHAISPRVVRNIIIIQSDLVIARDPKCKRRTSDNQATYTRYLERLCIVITWFATSISVLMFHVVMANTSPCRFS